MLKLTGLIIVSLVSFGLSIPLGIWRFKARKFSLSWFISIHLAVPLIYLLRLFEGLSYWSIPLFVLLSVIGQLAGGFLIKNRFNNKENYV